MDSKGSSVLQLQRYLLLLSRVDPDIPRVNPDGIYGSTTAAAVKAFQDKFMGGGNGLTDHNTWKMIVNSGKRAKRRLSRGDGIHPFDLPLKSGVLREGDRCITVGFLRLMLMSMTVPYPFLEGIGGGELFDSELRSAIERLQQIYGLPVSGIVDLDTWNAVALSFDRALDSD